MDDHDLAAKLLQAAYRILDHRWRPHYDHRLAARCALGSCMGEQAAPRTGG